MYFTHTDAVSKSNDKNVLQLHNPSDGELVHVSNGIRTDLPDGHLAIPAYI